MINEAIKLLRNIASGSVPGNPVLFHKINKIILILESAKSEPGEFTKECREYAFFDAEHSIENKAVGIIKRLHKACDIIDRQASSLKIFETMVDGLRKEIDQLQAANRNLANELKAAELRIKELEEQQPTNNKCKGCGEQLFYSNYCEKCNRNWES